VFAGQGWQPMHLPLMQNVLAAHTEQPVGDQLVPRPQLNVRDKV